jgi:hypothetical protein
MSGKNANIVIKGKNETGAVFKKIVGDLKNVDRAQRAVSGSSKSMMKGMSANRRVIQQVGMQVSDLGVQIAGGQSAILSLTQNVPQVVQMFGMWGGILAAVITLLGTFTLIMIKSGQSIYDVADAFGVASTEIKMFIDFLVDLRETAYDTINWLVNNLDLVALSLAALVGIHIANYIRKVGIATIATNLWTTSLKAFRAILVTTGVGALAVGIGYVIERLLTVQSVTGNVGKTFKIVSDLIIESFNRVILILSSVSVRIAKLSYGIEIVMVSAFRDTVAMIAKAINKFVSNMYAAYLVVKELFATLGVAIQNSMIDAFNSMTWAFRKGVKNMADTANLIPGINIEIGEDFGKIERVTERVGTLVDRLKDAKREGQDFTLLKDDDGAFSSGIDQRIKKLQDLSESAGKTADSLWNAATKPMDSWKALMEVLSQASQGDFDIRELMGKFKKVDDSLDKTKSKGKEAGDIFKALGKMADHGVGVAVNRFEEANKRMLDFTRDVRNTMQSNFKSLVTGAKSLKDVFLDTLQSIADRLLDFALDPVFDMIEQAMSGMFSGGGGNGGGMFGNIGSLFAGFFAKGGVIGSGKFGVVGENGPELVYAGAGPMSVIPNDAVSKVPTSYSPKSLPMGKSVAITNVNHFNGVTREEVMRDVQESQGRLKKQIDEEFPLNAQKYNNNFERGMVG